MTTNAVVIGARIATEQSDDMRKSSLCVQHSLIGAAEQLHGLDISTFLSCSDTGGDLSPVFPTLLSEGPLRGRATPLDVHCGLM